jgi:hypothetical protein
MPLSLLLGLLALPGEEGGHWARAAALGMHRCRGLFAFLAHALARFLHLRLVFRVDRRGRHAVTALVSLAAVPVALSLLTRRRTLLPR